MPPRRDTIALPGLDLMIQVTDDQSRTLVFRDSPIAYHSGSGAAAETEHVYLNNSGVRERLRVGKATSVLEIGLGTGLGMLMTLDAAIAAATPLRFESVECKLLDRSVLAQLQLERQLRQPWLVESFLDFRDSLGTPVPRGEYCWRPAEGQQIWLLCGEAQEFQYASRGLFDAVYFDPFAPAVNPLLWLPAFLRKMRVVLAGTGTLVTYCVNRQVRESFADAGFDVRRVAGPPGGKREVMIAVPRADQAVLIRPC